MCITYMDVYIAWIGDLCDGYIYMTVRALGCIRMSVIGDDGYCTMFMDLG